MMSRTPVDLSISQLFERLCEMLSEIEQLDQEQQANRKKLAQVLLISHQQGKELADGGDAWGGKADSNHSE